MCPELFKIGPLTVHGYGFMIAIGVLAAYYLSSALAAKAGLSEDMVTWLLGSIAVGGFLGSKVLNYITLIINGEFAIKELYNFRNGYVVYGGIIGGILASFLLCRIKKVDVWPYADIIMPTVALAQGFGRIGCFLAGCCYGKETDSVLGVVFPAAAQAPSGVKLFPIQLVFSIVDFAMFAVLFFLLKRKHFKGQIFLLYIIFYAIARFILENFRGDAARGQIGILSTSQVVSVFIFIAGVALYILMMHRGKDKKELKG